MNKKNNNNLVLIIIIIICTLSIIFYQLYNKKEHGILIKNDCAKLMLEIISMSKEYQNEKYCVVFPDGSNKSTGSNIYPEKIVDKLESELSDLEYYKYNNSPRLYLAYAKLREKTLSHVDFILYLEWLEDDLDISGIKVRQQYSKKMLQNDFPVFDKYMSKKTKEFFWRGPRKFTTSILLRIQKIQNKYLYINELKSYGEEYWFGLEVSTFSITPVEICLYDKSGNQSRWEQIYFLDMENKIVSVPNIFSGEFAVDREKNEKIKKPRGANVKYRKLKPRRYIRKFGPE